MGEGYNWFGSPEDRRQRCRVPAHVYLMGCTVARLQRICCFLFMRLATILLTALSTNAVEIGSPCRHRAA